MAEGKRFICNKCNWKIIAWSDGNPYYIDYLGKKHYAYHPNHHKLSWCVGNDWPQLCLECGEEFKNDTREPSYECPKCGDWKIISTFRLEGENCPFCKDGVFKKDPKYRVIS